MFEPRDQVFEPSNELNPAELYKAVVSSAKGITESSTLKRKFQADNGVNYVWDDEEDCWVVDENASDEEDARDHDDKADGSHENSEDENEWDGVASASTGSSNTQTLVAGEKKRKRKKRKTKKLPNNWIYITGLPRDATEEEVKAHFSKVGLIALHPADQTPKLKLYRDDAGECKGDCSICYNASESVEMAVNYLDGGYIRPSHRVTVARADFLQAREADESQLEHAPSGARRERTMKVSHAQVKVVQSAMQQALSWSEDDDSGAARPQTLKIVVLMGMFAPADFADPAFSEELEADLASECSKCGEVEKITVFERNPRGVVIVKYSTAHAAQACVQLMEGRYFGGRRIRCFFWDGVTDYTVSRDATQSEGEEKRRMEQFGDWLEKEQAALPAEFQLRTE